MKVLIISDTHGMTSNLDRVLERVGKVDMLLHLGDVERREDYIEAVAGCETHIIAGNNDFFSCLDREKLLRIGTYKVFMTHGHEYGVSMGTERIRAEGEKRGADIVLFGHTHVPLAEQGAPLLLNPGSLSLPRQTGRNPSYILLETGKNGALSYEIQYL